MLSGGYFNSDQLREMGFARVGENVRISTKVEIQDPSKVFLGNNIRVDAYVVITTGTQGFLKVGDRAHIADGVRISAAAGVTIGRFVGLASKVTILSSSDDYSGDFLVGPMVPPGLSGGKYIETFIGDFAVVGTASTVLPGCSLEEGVAVGAMSLVNRRLPPWGVYSGAPARYLFRRKQDGLERLDSIDG